jgi:hypothetical protein
MIRNGNGTRLAVEAGFLFLFNDCMDAGGRATHGAVADDCMDRK